MVFLRTFLLLTVMMLASALLSGEASAHAGHQHDQTISIIEADASPSHHDTENDSANLSPVGHANTGKGMICHDGCCAGICAVCCIILSDAGPDKFVHFISRTSPPWQYYQTPDDTLTLPDTPPPRV